ncbi:hypothetical protein QTP70_009635 [Hemibagrus guttatus]|uniref:ribonuclease H n=1 Tax=Hemibagrus guttatus TaxID=175788 RepID=A0AAE0QH10_9TELE|nr:hypothetical protein QTP70_009635 [Hemibagrus guttatus]
MVVCRMTLMVCKKKRSKIEKKTKWWKLKKEECCEECRQKLRQALGGQVVLPDDWETTAEVIRETGRKVLGVSSGMRKEDKETWWWNEEVQDSIQRKRLAKKKWDMDRTEENRQEYKELQRRVKREVSKAKQKAYDELYTRLDTREGEKDLYRLARQRDRDGKDVQQVRVIKDRDGRVLTSEESVQRRWKEYFEELMNEENEREKRVEGVNSVEQKVDKIRKDEVRKALKRMKSGKAVGPDDIPVEVWKCLGEAAVEFLASLFNRVLESERMPEEWRRSVLVPIFKNKGDVQSCSNYRGIKLMSYTMKVWERVVEARLRKVVEICEQQYGFMPRKSTTDAIFALRILMEKYRDGQRELHCVFVDLEKAYDRVPREELWYCMRKSGVAEKYVRVVQDMYERSRTVVRCAVGQTEEFNVEVGLHQGSALGPFLFAIVMDQLSEEVRQESPWTMMFADDIVICSESREQVEENLERWRFALERRGMKVSRSKTEYMCVNEREGSGTVRLQGEEVKKVQEFKYLGSTVQSNGECRKEVKKQVQAGWNGWRKVSGVLCDQKISARIKGKVYRTVVRAAMLYGLETVSLRKRQESELEVAELKMLSSPDKKVACSPEAHWSYAGPGKATAEPRSARPDREKPWSTEKSSVGSGAVLEPPALTEAGTEVQGDRMETPDTTPVQGDGGDVDMVDEPVFKVPNKREKTSSEWSGAQVVENSFLVGLPKLSERAARELDRELSLEELHEALQRMDNGRASGQDVLDVLRDSVRRGELPLSCRRAVLTLLPKKGDLTHLKNWRPVSLLCTDRKLLSKALASRLTKAIGTGLIFLDQEKAFDRVEHEYLWKVLEAFGFNPGFVAMIRVLYCEIESVLKVNWTKSEAILVGEWGGGQPSLPGGLAWKRGGFKYLGVYLGTNEFLNKNWEGSVEHVKGRLSRWKRLVPMMSYRGRTLGHRDAPESSVNVAGSDLSRAEDLAAHMGLRSLRVVNQLLHRWRSALTSEERVQLMDYQRTETGPTEDEPFPRLNIAPDLDGCAGPLLECRSEGEMDFGSVSGKLLYRACVKVLNKKKLSGRVDTPWRNVLGFNGDIKPEWTHYPDKLNLALYTLAILLATSPQRIFK